MDPRAGLEDMEKRKFLNLPGLELRPLGRPARSQSLYRLCCPDLSKSHDQFSFTITVLYHSTYMRKEERATFYQNTRSHIRKDYTLQTLY
jgi:hypothetical protein